MASWETFALDGSFWRRSTKSWVLEFELYHTMQWTIASCCGGATAPSFIFACQNIPPKMQNLE